MCFSFKFPSDIIGLKNSQLGFWPQNQIAKWCSKRHDENLYGRLVYYIDIYLSGLFAVIFVDWKHAWQIEADEYESDC